jgi:hypothetical protein
MGILIGSIVVILVFVVFLFERYSRSRNKIKVNTTHRRHKKK